MIVWASGLQMVGGRISKPIGEVGVLAIPDSGLYIKWHVESVCEDPLDAGDLRLPIHSVAVGLHIDGRCVVDRVEVTRWVIFAVQKIFTEDGMVEF